MTAITKTILIAALLVTAAALVTWQVTGGDYYTKFERIEQVEIPVDPDDPLAGTGFYDSESQTETVVKRGFRFGLLPTPKGIFDKHALSVVSVALPLWLGVIALLIRHRLRTRSRA